MHLNVSHTLLLCLIPSFIPYRTYDTHALNTRWRTDAFLIYFIFYCSYEKFYFWKIRFQIKMFPKFLNGFNRRLTTLEEVKDIKMLYTQKGIYCINWTFNEISDRHEDNDYNRLITIIIRQKLTKENKIYGRVMMDNNTLNWKWTIRKWIKMSFYF